jgi:hypothetical protein
MFRILIIAAVFAIGGAFAVAQQPENSDTGSAQRGSAYPPVSQRGPNFPKSVSPDDSNPANWVGAPAPLNTGDLPSPRGWRWWSRRGWWRR